MKPGLPLKFTVTAYGIFSSTIFFAQKETAWNIVFITSDQHNPKIMGCAGNPIIKTPAMDRLAGEGVYFSKAYCCTPTSAPTRQTIITGLYPQEHGQLSNAMAFDPRIPTWAHFLKSKGYKTAFFGKSHTYTTDDQLGFDVREEDPKLDWSFSQLGKQLPAPPYDQSVYEAIFDDRFKGNPLTKGTARVDGRTLVKSLDWIDANKNENFFIHCSFSQPHYGWVSPENFYLMYNPDNIDFEPIIPDQIKDNWKAKDLVSEYQWTNITEAQHRLCKARYYGSISYIDNCIGEILNLLDQLNLSKKTIVVYSSDHGEMAAEKGMWFKDNMYDAAARVPLIIRMPDVIRAASKYDSLISHVDYFPTIMGLANISSNLPENLSGINLAEKIKNPAQASGTGRKYAFCANQIDKNTVLPPVQMMVCDSRYKYIKYTEKGISKTESELLYDMQNDPSELTNLATNTRYNLIMEGFRSAMTNHLQTLKARPYDYIYAGINEKKIQEKQVKTYPNPSNGIFTIEAPIDTKFQIYNILGSMVYEGNCNSEKQTVNLPETFKGSFLIKANQEKVCLINILR